MPISIMGYTKMMRHFSTNVSDNSAAEMDIGQEGQARNQELNDNLTMLNTYGLSEVRRRQNGMLDPEYALELRNFTKVVAKQRNESAKIQSLSQRREHYRAN